MASPRLYLAHRTLSLEKARSLPTDTPSTSIERSRINLEAFRQVVCNHATLPHQRVWERALVTGQDSPCLHAIAGDDTLILAPRDSAKSTFLLEFLAWVIGRHASVGMELRIVYISYKTAIAEEKGLRLQRIIESSQYQLVFPSVRPGKKWSVTQWEIDWEYAGLSPLGEPYTFAAAGITGAVTSKRGHLFVLDDLVKSPADIKSPTVRAEMVSNWRDAISPLRVTGGRFVCLGTLMRNDDIYSTEFTLEEDWENVPSAQLFTFRSSRDWNVIRQSALIQDPTTGEESSYWEPDYAADDKAYGMPLVRLQRIRELMLSTFFYQYQNHRVSDEETTNPVTVHMVEKGFLPLEKFECLVVGGDLAAGKKSSSCYSALVLGGFKLERVKGRRSPVPRFYIIDAWEGKLVGNIEKLDALLEFKKEWGHRSKSNIQFWVESNAYQKSIAGDFSTYLVDMLGEYDLSVVEVPSSGLISDRLQSISGLFQNRLVTFSHYCTHLGKIVHQLTNPDPRTLESRSSAQATDIKPEDLPRNDLLQALILCLQGLRKLRPLSAASLESGVRNQGSGVREEPTPSNANQRALCALQSDEPVICTGDEYRSGVRRTILGYAEQCSDTGDMVRMQKALTEVQRLDGMLL